jgi:ParB-like chromosome segregation protein Spo0J
MNHHHDLAISYRSPTDILSNTRNARTHSKRQTDQIAKSISAFGFTNPVLVDEESTLIAGHGRIAAANKLGIYNVPVITLSGLSEAE